MLDPATTEMWEVVNSHVVLVTKPLQEHQVLLTPESYLQPLKQVILKICFNFAIMLGASQDQSPQESS